MATATELFSTPKFIGVQEASATYSVSISTLRSLINKRKLTPYRPSGTRRVLLSVRELDQLLEASAQ